jgi:hypothetical protein
LRKLPNALRRLWSRLAIRKSFYRRLQTKPLEIHALMVVRVIDAAVRFQGRCGLNAADCPSDPIEPPFPDTPFTVSTFCVVSYCRIGLPSNVEYARSVPSSAGTNPTPGAKLTAAPPLTATDRYGCSAARVVPQSCDAERSSSHAATGVLVVCGSVKRISPRLRPELDERAFRFASNAHTTPDFCLAATRLLPSGRSTSITPAEKCQSAPLMSGQ